MEENLPCAPLFQRGVTENSSRLERLSKFSCVSHARRVQPRLMGNDQFSKGKYYLALGPVLEYDAATSARWMVLNDETSIDSVLDVAALLAVGCASCRGGAGARQYRRGVGEQQHAQSVGGAGAGAVRQAWHRRAADFDSRRLDPGGELGHRRDSAGVYLRRLGARCGGAGCRRENADIDLQPRQLEADRQSAD